MTTYPRIGCAGWSLSSAVSSHFPSEGSHLERYSKGLNCVEINSSFYRPHQPTTYARWRDSVPDDFRFSVKMPRAISHQARLRDCEPALLRFLDEAGQLGPKMGCLLLQLPPSLRFELPVAQAFFELLRRHVTVPVVCEPRHATWGSEAAAQLLSQARVDCVQADPAVIDTSRLPVQQLLYIRLHGSPVIYRSAYSQEYLDSIAARMHASAHLQPWCIFDNTADGAAVPNALSLAARFPGFLSAQETDDRP